MRENMDFFKLSTSIGIAYSNKYKTLLAAQNTYSIYQEGEK